MESESLEPTQDGSCLYQRRNLERTPDESESCGERCRVPSVYSPEEPQATPAKATWHFFLESSQFRCSSCDFPNVTPSESCPSEADLWLHVAAYPCLSKWGLSHASLPTVRARTWVDLWPGWAGVCLSSWSWPSVILFSLCWHELKGRARPLPAMDTKKQKELRVLRVPGSGQGTAAPSPGSPHALLSVILFVALGSWELYPSRTLL